jgi:transcriptional regulator with XRE-family HTH domain
MIHLGKTARYLRERKKLSQREAADALGITQVHLSNIENNKALPSASLIARYRDLWGVDLYVLAWCLHGDPNQLPEAVRVPMQELATAWRRELGELIDDTVIEDRPC